MKEGMKEDMEERNILLFQMSMLKTKTEPPVNHYFYEEKGKTTDKPIRFHFDGQSQLEPGTKYLIYKLAGEGKKIDRIIVLNTDETVKTGANNPISAYNYYCEKMNEFWKMIRNTYENGSLECENKESNDALIEAFIPEITKKALSGFASADIDSNAFGERGLIDTIESSIRNAINGYCKQINNGSDEKKKKGLVEFETLKEIVGDLVDKIKKEIENRFDKMSGLDSVDGYNAIEHMVKEDIDAVPVDQLEKMELTELFKRFQKYASEVELLGNTGKQFLKKGNREIWFRYLLSKLSYYYKKEYYEKKGIREEADFYQKRAEVAEKKADFYQKRAEVAEKKARILEQQSEYYMNNIRQHLNTFIREYAYYYCLENNLLLYENKQKMKDRKLQVKKQYYSDGCGMKVTTEPQKSPIQIDTVKIVNDDLNSALFELKNCLDTIQEEESKEESKVRLNIYIDMQGGDRSGAFLFSSVLKLIDSKTMFVKEQFATNFVPQRISHQVVDKTRQYDVEKLSSGMNAFLRYGRADELCVYLEKMDPDGKDKDFMETIQKLGNAISICDPEEFENELKIINSFISPTKNKTEKTVFDLLIGEFDREFKPLLKKGANVLDRIEWFLNKGFTQQALTYIESKMPDYIIGKMIQYTVSVDGKETTDRSQVPMGNQYETNLNDVIINHTHEKYYKTWKVQNLESIKNELAALLTKCTCIETPKQIQNDGEKYIRFCVEKKIDDEKLCVPWEGVLKWLDKSNIEQSGKQKIQSAIHDSITNPTVFLGKAHVKNLREVQLSNDQIVNCIMNTVWKTNRKDVVNWCEACLRKRRVDILFNMEKIDSNNPVENDFWKTLIKTDNQEWIRKIKNKMEERGKKYRQWISILHGDDKDQYEEAFVGVRSMLEDSWVKKELKKKHSVFTDENAEIDIDSIKAFFDMSDRNDNKSEFYTVLSDKDVPGDIVAITTREKSDTVVFKTNKGEFKIKFDYLIPDKKEENITKLQSFLKLHSAFRKERNNTNHASENGERVPYPVLNHLINEYIKYARELTPPTLPKTQLND